MYEVLKGGNETRHPSTFVMSRPKGVPNYLILIIHTEGKFCIAEHSFDVKPGSALLLAPNTPYSYTNPNGRYIDDWLHFNISDDEERIHNFPCINEPFSTLKTDHLSHVIRQLLWEASYTEPPYKQQNIDALFTVLVNHLTVAYQDRDKISKHSPYQEQLQALRLQLWNSLSEKHTIREYAKAMGVSESYFQHLYTNYFGISFQQDLINLRIEHAKYNLQTTDLTMEQIAEICGYTNEVHFYRQFKTITGTTPAKYRKK